MSVVSQLVALVTGGASGLGRATAQRLVRQGARVVIMDLPNSHGAATAEEIGSNCCFAPTDVTKEKDVMNAIQLAREKFDRIRLVVNCAGIALARKTVNKDGPHTLEDFNKVMMVNTVGTFNVIRLCADDMVKDELPPGAGSNPDERGLIINVASVLGLDGQPGMTAYSASKAAVASMTLPIARDLSRNGIRVCTIAPGAFLTPMLTNNTPKEILDWYTKLIPYPKRFGDPDEFAQLVEAVVENPMLNGSVVRLDGALRVT
ncbi:3-hydroxyacyl-CoA dehydrogenase type-2 [Trichoplax sp. H2]|nr:3-hydroxyacyl-CoA dehydrogenase type-2 [Trichoplax sp. H2]|eukprot:RDD39382.1 3-hydroxyacyl-CoA dehydrogenase type-2 [Trichoplax sp. H2]